MVTSTPNRHATDNRLFLAACLMIVISGIGLVLIIDTKMKTQIIDEFRRDIELELEQRAHQFKTSVDASLDVVDFFHATPPIKGIVSSYGNEGVDPSDGTTLESWYKRIETIFEAYLENYQHINQVRIIKFDERGNELVRVEQVKGNIKAIEHNSLQPKASREYYVKAKQLLPGEHYISPINLNREWEKIEYPFNPTYRVARNIYDEGYQPFGLLIVNVDAKLILSAIKENLARRFQLYLVNAQGGAIIHPQSDEAFQFEFDSDRTWSSGQPRQGNGVFSDFRSTPQDNNDFIFLSRTLQLITANNEMDLEMIIGFNISEFKREVAKRRTLTVALISTLIIITLLVLAYYRRLMNTRLGAMRKEAEYEAIVDSSNDAIISMDLDGVITSWNRSAEDIYGYSERHALGKYIFDLILKSDQDLHQALLSRVALGESIPAFEMNSTHARGKDIPVSITLSPITINYKNEISGAAAIIRDVTDQRDIKQKLLDVNSSLEQQVNERTRELEKAKNNALELSKVKSDFIANVSHEIRTPMNGVVGMLHLLEKEPLSEQQQKYLNMATKSASALTSLINDILDLSKIESGKFEIVKSEFDVIHLLSDICTALTVSAQEKGLRLICDFSQVQHTQLCSDANRIRQILVNLIGNAIKFTAKGKIVVTARTEVLENQEINLYISVKDTGLGITKDKQEKLFQSFSQADSTTARKYGGTGLGLAISKNLCQLLGGDIAIRSKIDSGTTLSFYIKAEYGAKPTEHIMPHQNIWCLVAIEDSDIQCSLGSTLKILGAETDSLPALTTKSIETVQQRERNKEISYVFCTAEDPMYKKLTESEFTLKIQLTDKPGNELDVDVHELSIPFTPYDIYDIFGYNKNAQNRLDTPDHSSDGELKTLLKIHQGRRILLVDDNEINIEVGRGVLEDYGLEIDTAANGQIALDKLNSKSFDLLIMDCQMPIMDGYSTTRAIRRGDARKENIDITIIAMTASAMSGEKDVCLKSGMNDFISKPIDPSEMAEKLLFWLNLSNKKSMNSTTQNPPHNNQEPEELKEPDERERLQEEANTTLESTVWHREEALKRVKNRSDRLCILIDIFLSSFPEKIIDLQKLIKIDKFNEVAKIAHEIKGVSGNLGAQSLYLLSEKIEVAALDKNKKELDLLVEFLNSTLYNLIEELTVYKKENAA